MRSRMRLANSARSMICARPESTASSRRRISASHSLAASASAGPSRLWTSSRASSARSASGRFSASFRRRSVILLAMAITRRLAGAAKVGSMPSRGNAGNRGVRSVSRVTQKKRPAPSDAGLGTAPSCGVRPPPRPEVRIARIHHGPVRAHREDRLRRPPRHNRHGWKAAVLPDSPGACPRDGTR